jgi:hypothetical protein
MSVQAEQYGVWGTQNITALPTGSCSSSGKAPNNPSMKMNKPFKANPYEFAPCPNCGGDDTSSGSNTYADSPSGVASASAQANALLSSVKRWFTGTKSR